MYGDKYDSADGRRLLMMTTPADWQWRYIKGGYCDGSGDAKRTWCIMMMLMMLVMISVYGWWNMDAAE